MSRILTPETLNPDPEMLLLNRREAAVRHVLESLPFEAVLMLREKLNAGLPVLVGSDQVVRLDDDAELVIERSGLLRCTKTTAYGDPLVEALPDAGSFCKVCEQFKTGNAAADRAFAEEVLARSYREIYRLDVDREQRFAGMSYSDAIAGMTREQLELVVAHLAFDYIEEAPAIAACEIER